MFATEYQTVIYMMSLIFIAYGIGSIPTGYLLVKAVKGIDIRQEGSGSTGATNVKRILGTKAFFAVMILDALKGFLPVLGVKYLEQAFMLHPELNILPVLASIAVIIGHSKSMFLNFSGGKSVASGVGTIFGLCWPVGLITAVIWGAITYTTKYVSVGSIVAILLTPIWMFIFKQPLAYIFFCLFGGLYITLYLHRENIKRLMSGKESKVR